MALPVTLSSHQGSDRSSETTTGLTGFILVRPGCVFMRERKRKTCRCATLRCSCRAYWPRRDPPDLTPVRQCSVITKAGLPPVITNRLRGSGTPAAGNQSGFERRKWLWADETDVSVCRYNISEAVRAAGERHMLLSKTLALPSVTLLLS